MKFRRKPSEVEAFQLTRERMDEIGESAVSERDSLPASWPHWLHMAWNTPKDENGALFLDPEYHGGTIERFEAFRLMHAEPGSTAIIDIIEPGDWIVCESCRSEIQTLAVFPPEAFNDNFEPVR